MDATLTSTPRTTKRAPRPAHAGEAPASSPESIAPELRGFIVPIDSLTLHPRNPRRGNLDAISESLRRFGQLRAVVVQRSTGYVVAGNHLVRAARALGWQNLAATVLDLDDATASAYLLADNRTSDLGTYNDALLAALLEEQAAAGNLAGTGYGQTDIDELLARLLAEVERKGDPDAIPEAPTADEIYVRRGERWRLGRQVLFCGDALDHADVARLLAGAEPTLLSCDPPYGVSLDGSWRDGVIGPRPRGGRGAGHRTTTLSGDTRVDWSEAFALVPSLQVGYVWHAAIHAPAVAAGLERIGFDVVSQIIWDKGLFALGRSWYQWMHEPAWVVRKRGAKVGFFGERNQATVWRVPSPKMVAGGSAEASLDHPTQKPVLLSEIPIANHLRGSDSVYDPFVGSGTTLIAAERLGRRCYAMEIDPKFAQLTIERWQSYTGERAVREEAGA
jgi:hypothetical protein